MSWHAKGWFHFMSASPQKHKKVGLIHTSVSSSVSWILPNPQPLKSPLMLSKDATSPWSRPCNWKFGWVSFHRACLTMSAVFVIPIITITIIIFIIIVTFIIIRFTTIVTFMLIVTFIIINIIIALDLLDHERCLVIPIVHIPTAWSPQIWLLDLMCKPLK